ncbi:hypothetical protein L228DRAFT_271327 [Xylona heveae TC161]|uniref:MARVEL domain-containing protein n=1 Tax=Xylona heveae (strain CBS 132557 / TC161) TaxID=1328760 RepID=A0A164ZUC6_XYLHT|nr:hypothetical protein L228DRAFT_271327 [Xylona heveae TC161]KZF19532.1 hypothetical protein L228DRAFT_271327 [Xylona heveae TC161]
MGLGGLTLKLTATTLRCIQFLASALILAIFSYYLAVLANRDLTIARWMKAVEGMSGAAVLYTILAILFTCFLGGVTFFALVAILLDICFVGCFVAIAILTRHGVGSCTGNVNTPLGSGPANSGDPGYGKNGFGFHHGDTVTYAPNLGQACKLEKSSFAVAIINIMLFIFSALLQLALRKHHQKDKRFGPSPANNYTGGAGRKPFFRRRRGPKTTRDAYGNGAAAELGTINSDKPHADMRPSAETGYTGSTMAAPDHSYKYAPEPTLPSVDNSHGYYTSPTTNYGATRGHF